MGTMENYHASHRYTCLMFGLRFYSSNSLIFLLLVTAFLFSVYTASAAENDVGTTTAVTAATNALNPPKEATPVAFITEDSERKAWYIVDFYNFFHNQGKKMYYLGRVIVNPATGKVITNTSDGGKYAQVIDDLNKLVGVQNVDPTTGEIGYAYTEEDARGIAGDALALTSDYTVYKSSLIEGETQYYWVIDFVRYDSFAKKFYWGRRAIVDPYYGNVVTDPAVIQYFRARATDIPEEFDPLTKEQLSGRKTLSGDLKKPFQGSMALLFTIIAFVALASGIVYWRKKIARLSRVDIVFGAAILVQLFFVFYLYRYSSDTTYIWLLISVFSTLTYWVTTRAAAGETGAQEELSVILPKDLPKFSDVGGMEKVKEELRNTVGLIVSQGKLAQQYGVKFNGILLFGPPGVGKSYIAGATAGEFGLNFLSLKVSDLIGIYKGTSTHKIQQAFKTALKHAPCLLFFDEFESVAGERGVVSVDVEETRVVNQLLRSLEEIRSQPGKVIVFAATNKKEDLDEAIIRPGRFDKHIYIPMPDDAARKSIIEARLRGKPLGLNIDLDELVGKTTGMSAADIAAIVDKAVLDILSASLGAAPQAKTLDQKQLVWAVDNFREKQKPLLKKLNWSELILQEEVTAELKRFVKIIENPDITRKLGIEPPKGVLIYGPPGTGKTTIAKVIANEANASFFSIGAADINTKWFGESERKIKNIFEEARKYKPSIIFIDEIESIVSKRGGHEGWEYMDKLVSQILQEIDGMKDTAHVFIIGATNIPDAIDPALLRGGRLSTQIEIPLPGKPEREKLFDLFLKKTNKTADVNLGELAGLAEGYSGADIQDICQRAILDVFDKSGGEAKEVAQTDLKESLQKYKKSSKAYNVPEYIKKGS